MALCSPVLVRTCSLWWRSKLPNGHHGSPSKRRSLGSNNDSITFCEMFNPNELRASLQGLSELTELTSQGTQDVADIRWLPKLQQARHKVCGAGAISKA